MSFRRISYVIPDSDNLNIQTSLPVSYENTQYRIFILSTNKLDILPIPAQTHPMPLTTNNSYPTLLLATPPIIIHLSLLHLHNLHPNPLKINPQLILKYHLISFYITQPINLVKKEFALMTVTLIPLLKFHLFQRPYLHKRLVKYKHQNLQHPKIFPNMPRKKPRLPSLKTTNWALTTIHNLYENSSDFFSLDEIQHIAFLQNYFGHSDPLKEAYNFTSDITALLNDLSLIHSEMKGP